MYVMREDREPRYGLRCDRPGLLCTCFFNKSTGIRAGVQIFLYENPPFCSLVLLFKIFV